MKTLNAALALAATALICGCVSRTITVEPQHRGGVRKGKSYGSDPQSKLVEKKLIWIWQDEFRNPK